MTAVGLIILNLSEVRRRSVLVWKSIPDNRLNWKPDDAAISLGEMIRHVWEGMEGYRRIIQNSGSLELPDSYTSETISSTKTELELAATHFTQFIRDVQTFSETDLEQKIIDRSDVGYKRKLGDFLARVAYHEAVHTGQMLQYMRAANIPRPNIWD
jgi:uncharacterized damage-inducible protein DinB